MIDVSANVGSQVTAANGSAYRVHRRSANPSMGMTGKVFAQGLSGKA
jgi:hypothetical protein